MTKRKGKGSAPRKTAGSPGERLSHPKKCIPPAYNFVIVIETRQNTRTHYLSKSKSTIHIIKIELNRHLHVRKRLNGSNQILAIKWTYLINFNFNITVRFHSLAKSHNNRILHIITSRGYLLVSIPK